MALDEFADFPDAPTGGADPFADFPDAGSPDEPSASWGQVLSDIPGMIADTTRATIAGMQRKALEDLQRAHVDPQNPNGLTLGMSTEADASLAPALEDATARFDAAKPGMQSTPGANIWQRGVQTGAVSASQVAPALAVGLGTRNPQLAASMMFPTTEGLTYGNLRSEGLDPRRAGQHAAVQGGIEVGTELLPFDFLLKNGDGFVKKTLGFLMRELPGESLATLGQGASDYVAAAQAQGQPVTPELVWEGVKKAAEDLPDTWVATVIGGGMQTGPVAIAQRLASGPQTGDTERDRFKARVDEFSDFPDATAEAMPGIAPESDPNLGIDTAAQTAAEAPSEAPVEPATTVPPAPEVTAEPTAEASPAVETPSVDVEATIAPVVKRWGENSPEVEVVESGEQLPEHVLQSVGPQAEGAYDPSSGKVWLVKGNLSSPEAALRVLRHEAVGHHGMINMLGPRWKAVKGQVRALAQRDEQMGAIAKEVASSYADQSEDVQNAEIVARFAEQNPTHPVIEQLKAWVREQIRTKLGIDLELTTDDLIAMLRRAEKFNQSSPSDEAVLAARPQKTRNTKGDLLIQEVSRTRDSRYFGAPTPSGKATEAETDALAETVLEKATERGKPFFDKAAFWYEKAGNMIRALAHGDAKLVEDMTRIVAYMSADSSLGTNVAAAVESAYHIAKGDKFTRGFGRYPVSGRTDATHLNRVMEAERFDSDLPGVSDKVMSFYRNLRDPAFQVDEWADESTLDVWMHRLFGHKSASGTFTPVQYAYGREVLIRAAKLANKRLGRSDLKPRHIQAAAWVNIRKSDVAEFGDYVNRRTAFMPWETRSEQLVPDLATWPAEVQERFRQEAIGLAHGVLDEVGLAPLQAETSGEGVWDGVISPNTMTMVVLRGGAASTIDPAPGRLFAQVIGYGFGQDAALSYVPTHDAKVSESHPGVELIIEQGKLDTATVRDVLPDLPLSEFTMPDGRQAFHFLNMEEGLSQNARQAWINKVRSALTRLVAGDKINATMQLFRARGKLDFAGDGGGTYLQGLGEAGRSDLQDRARRLRADFQALAEKYRAEVKGTAAPAPAPNAGEVVLGSRPQRATDTPAFKRWFGDSKVVDAKGEPLVVYHGTKSDISEFQPSRGGEYGSGIYFTADEGAASMYAGRSSGESGENVLPVYLSLRNPFLARNREAPRALGMKRLRAMGHDGIIATGPTGERQYIVFDSAQVKSAFNRGTFDPNDPSILAAQPPVVTPSHVEVGGGTYTTAPIEGVDRDTQRVILEVMRAEEANVADARGNSGEPITWEDTGGEAQALLEGSFGRTFNSLVNRLPRSTANAKLLESFARIVNAAGKNVQAKVEQYNLTNSAQDLAHLNAAREQLGVVLAPFMGYRTEAGRALNILRKVQSDFADASAIFDALGDGNENAMKDFARRVKNAGSVADVLELTRASYKPTALDQFREYWINSLLSGPWTHVVNVTSNTAFQMLDAATEVVVSLGSKNVSTRAALARFSGMMAGVQVGITNARRAFLTEEAQLDQRTQMDGGKSRAISGKKGKIIRLPSRLLMAEDEFAKAVNFTGELYRLAMEQAIERSPDNPHAVFEQVLQEFATNRKVKAQAMAHADRMTFQSPLGAGGQKVMALREWTKIGWMIAPFVRTPTNILKRAMEYTPTALAMPTVRETLKAGGRDAAIAKGRMLVGSAVMFGVVNLVLQGMLTGAGPDDPAERELWMRLGKKPYSVKVGDEWVRYNRFEPIGMLVGVAADMAEMSQVAGAGQMDKLGTMLLASVMLNLADKTYLRGITDFMQATLEPKRYLSQWAAGMVGAVVPNISAQTARARDPLVRETRGIVDTLKGRLPGLRETLPAKLDVAGQPIDRAVFEPAASTPERRDPLAEAMLSLGVFKRGPGRTITLKGRQVELTGAQYQSLKAAMQQTRWEKLTPYVQGAEFQRLVAADPAHAQQALGTAYEKVGDVAKRLWLRDHEDVLEQLRATPVKRRPPSNYASE
jgi:hypothetical protein